MIGLTHYLAVSAVLFCIGIYGLLTRRSAIMLYMSIEILLNAANLNFVAFSRYIVPHTLSGQIFALFALAVSAAELGVGIAIILLLFRHTRTTDAKAASEMGG